MFRVGSFMFIGKFIHCANKITGNVSSRHHLEFGFTSLVSKPLMHPLIRGRYRLLHLYTLFKLLKNKLLIYL